VACRTSDRKRVSLSLSLVCASPPVNLSFEGDQVSDFFKLYHVVDKIWPRIQCELTGRKTDNLPSSFAKIKNE